MSIVKLCFAELNGKRIAFGSETVFTVEVGKGSKGSYKHRFGVKGDLQKAVLQYNCINIGNGYKKRLCMNGQVLHKLKS